MPTMTKRVNIQARTAIRNTKPPIYGTINDIIMSTGDILKCLVKKATVDEILPDGSTVRLNYKNYYLDNGAGLDAISNTAKIKPKNNIKPAIKEEPKVEFISESIEKDKISDTLNIKEDNTVKETEQEAVSKTIAEEKSEDNEVKETEQEAVSKTVSEEKSEVVKNSKKKSTSSKNK